MTLARSDLRNLVARIGKLAKTDPEAAQKEAEELVSKSFFEAGAVFEELESLELIRGSGVGLARQWADAAKAQVIANWRK